MTRLTHTLTLLTLAAFAVSPGAESAAQETEPVLHIDNLSTAQGQSETVPDERHDWSYERPPTREDRVAAAIQQRAQLRAQQRSLRIAAQKWYGVSNLRPTVTPTPWWSSYRPAWGQRSFQRFAWYRMPASAASSANPSSTSIR